MSNCMSIKSVGALRRRGSNSFFSWNQKTISPILRCTCFYNKSYLDVTYQNHVFITFVITFLYTLLALTKCAIDKLYVFWFGILFFGFLLYDQSVRGCPLYMRVGWWVKGSEPALFVKVQVENGHNRPSGKDRHW